MRKLASEFELKFGMLQAFECIYGTLMRIKCPIENLQDCYNHKQFSLNVQAVCDSHRRLIDIESKWPVSDHDEKVLANFAISKNLREFTSYYLQCHFTRTRSYSKLFNWWPSISPKLPYSRKEYQNCSINSEVIFNNLLWSTRNQVECSFEILKAWLGFLRKMVDLELESVHIVVYCCFVL